MSCPGQAFLASDLEEFEGSLGAFAGGYIATSSHQSIQFFVSFFVVKMGSEEKAYT